jgi:hypothetical protein
MVNFTVDQAGEYLIRVAVELVFEDDLYPGKRTATAEFKLTAEGDPVGGGCATVPGAGSAVGLLAMLLGLVGLRLRRR